MLSLCLQKGFFTTIHFYQYYNLKFGLQVPEKMEVLLFVYNKIFLIKCARKLFRFLIKLLPALNLGESTVGEFGGDLSASNIDTVMWENMARAP